jgi:hypothetical protein
MRRSWGAGRAVWAGLCASQRPRAITGTGPCQPCRRRRLDGITRAARDPQIRRVGTGATASASLTPGTRPRRAISPCLKRPYILSTERDILKSDKRSGAWSATRHPICVRVPSSNRLAGRHGVARRIRGAGRIARGLVVAGLSLRPFTPRPQVFEFQRRINAAMSVTRFQARPDCFYRAPQS